MENSARDSCRMGSPVRLLSSWHGSHAVSKPLHWKGAGVGATGRKWSRQLKLYSHVVAATWLLKLGRYLLPPQCWLVCNSYFCLLCELAGLHKNYWTHYHGTGGRGSWSRMNPLNYDENLDQRVYPELFYHTQKGSFLTWSLFFQRITHGSRLNKSDTFLGLIIVSVCNLVQIQIRIQIKWIWM